MKRNVVIAAAVLAGFCGVVLAGSGFSSNDKTGTVASNVQQQPQVTVENRWEVDVMKLSANLNYGLELLHQQREVCSEPDTPECKQETTKLIQARDIIFQEIEDYHKHYPFKDFPNDVLEKVLAFSIPTSGM
jgi:hypothetical protein|nr:MAG TPA: hypothetical protein [Caudoviricetes sp.]